MRNFSRDDSHNHAVGMLRDHPTFLGVVLGHALVIGTLWLIGSGHSADPGPTRHGLPDSLPTGEKITWLDPTLPLAVSPETPNTPGTGDFPIAATVPATPKDSPKNPVPLVEPDVSSPHLSVEDNVLPQKGGQTDIPASTTGAPAETAKPASVPEPIPPKPEPEPAPPPEPVVVPTPGPILAENTVPQEKPPAPAEVPKVAPPSEPAVPTPPPIKAPEVSPEEFPKPAPAPKIEPAIAPVVAKKPESAPGDGSDDGHEPAPAKPVPKAVPVTGKGNSGHSNSTPGGPVPPGSPSGSDLSLEQMQSYRGEIQETFSKEWLRPYHLAYSGQNYVATVRFRIRQDGTISNVTLSHPSGNKEMDKSVMQAAKRVRHVSAIPTGARSKYYEIFVEFAITPVAAKP